MPHEGAGPTPQETTPEGVNRAVDSLGDVAPGASYDERERFVVRLVDLMRKEAQEAMARWCSTVAASDELRAILAEAFDPIDEYPPPSGDPIACARAIVEELKLLRRTLAAYKKRYRVE